ncbi:MAG: NADH-quinone oxidoreductase subunit C [Nitrosopumilus sp.]
MSSASEKPVEVKPEEKPTTDSKPVVKKPEEKPTTDSKPVVKKPEEKPVELPAFEKSISDKIVEKFGDKVEVAFIKKDRVGINVSRENVHDVAEFIRDGLNYDHVESVSGVDYPQEKEIAVVYHIGSYTDPSLARQILVLSTRAQREENPIPGSDATKLPTLRDIFYSVEFHEREIFEMFGVYFEGHPDNRRLLLPEDWADLPPLRKDFTIKGR